MDDFKICDTVKVIEEWLRYSTYKKFFRENDIDDTGFELEQLDLNKAYTICFIGRHKDANIDLAVITDGENKYLFELKGLEKISSAESKDKILDFVKNKCDFDCQQKNVEKLIKMLLKRIDK